MINKKLRKTLLQMAKNDQAMRLKAVKTGRWNKKVDIENTKQLKKIAAKYGWLDRKLVGSAGADAAWLLVQHADHDIKFQEQCLNLLWKLVAFNDNSSQQRHFAYLLDRILVKKFGKQIFGTQFKKLKNSRLQPFPIHDIKNLNKRRRLYGLETFKNVAI